MEKKETSKAEKKKNGDNRKEDIVAMSSAATSIVGILLLFSPLMYIGVSLIILGGILGVIGLIRIKQNPEEKKGKIWAWIGIMGFILIVLFMLLILASLYGLFE